MEQQAKTIAKFSCPSCGKQYAWKAQLAGRRAKCACGAMVEVPAAPAPAPVPKRTAASENPLDDAYDFAPADEAPPPRRATTSVAAAAQPAAAVGDLGYVATQSRAEKYKRTTSAEEALHSKPRDVYLPYGLILAAAAAMIAWAMHQLGISAAGVMAVSVIAGVITLIKTGIILGLALLLAPKLGISFGDFPTAVRKLIAVVVVSDACLLWAGTIMDATGATREGWISIREIVVKTVLAAAVISALCHYLFDMDAEETGQFAVPLALVSLVLGFVLKVLALVVLAVALGKPVEGDEEAGTGDGAPSADGKQPVTATSPSTAPSTEEAAPQ